MKSSMVSGNHWGFHRLFILSEKIYWFFGESIAISLKICYAVKTVMKKGSACKPYNM